MTTEPWASVEDLAKNFGVAKASVYFRTQARIVRAHETDRRGANLHGLGARAASEAGTTDEDHEDKP